MKPSLAPVILWTVVRRRWQAFVAALASGLATVLVGLILVGPEAMLDWLRLLTNVQLDGYWDNASLPSAAYRLFRENEFVDSVAKVPWMVPFAYVLGVAVVVLSVVKARQDAEMGLWSLVSASLLASPVAWHNYLVLLGPGILLLLARGRVAPALLLLALQLIPPQWPDLWKDEGTTLSALALTLYLYILARTGSPS